MRLTKTSKNCGGQKVEEKISPEFFRLFRKHKLTFPQIIAQKVTVIMIIWRSTVNSLSRVCKSILEHFCILKTASNDTILSVAIFHCTCTEFPNNSLRFPGSENSPIFPQVYQANSHPVNAKTKGLLRSPVCTLDL